MNGWGTWSYKRAPSEWVLPDVLRKKQNGRLRKIAGIALDTLSIDYGKSPDFRIHRIICGADKPALENMAALDKLPVKGATLSE